MFYMLLYSIVFLVAVLLKFSLVIEYVLIKHFAALLLIQIFLFA